MASTTRNRGEGTMGTTGATKFKKRAYSVFNPKYAIYNHEKKLYKWGSILVLIASFVVMEIIIMWALIQLTN